VHLVQGKIHGPHEECALSGLNIEIELFPALEPLFKLFTPNDILYSCLIMEQPMLKDPAEYLSCIIYEENWSWES
jgi:hypothetical protein